MYCSILQNDINANKILIYEMLYITLLVAFIAFTLLDVLTTVVGLAVGCVELNPVVITWGTQFWAIFRVLLLGGMVTVFFAIHRLCLNHFQKGLRIMEALLFMLDSYIGAIVFSSFLAISFKLVF
jgi:hypothetical protein